MSSESSSASNSKKLWVDRVLAGGAGYAVSAYFGFVLILPILVAAAVIWYVGKKVAPVSNPRYLTAIVIQGAHLVWISLGTAFLGAWAANFLDIVILVIGLAWLWLRPSLWPIMLLTVFQIFALVVNTTMIVDHLLDGAGSRPLMIHIGLRIAGLVSMWLAFLRTRKPRRDT